MSLIDNQIWERTLILQQDKEAIAIKNQKLPRTQSVIWQEMVILNSSRVRSSLISMIFG